MGGFRRLCRLYGGIKINDVEYKWDYVKEEPVLKKEFTKEQEMASEKAKWMKIKDQI